MRYAFDKKSLNKEKVKVKQLVEGDGTGRKLEKIYFQLGDDQKRAYLHNRHIVKRSVSQFSENGMEITREKVKSGDLIVTVSDGVLDNLVGDLLDQVLGELYQKHISSQKIPDVMGFAMELRNRAFDMSTKDRRKVPWAKPDDIGIAIMLIGSEKSQKAAVNEAEQPSSVEQQSLLAKLSPSLRELRSEQLARVAEINYRPGNAARINVLKEAERLRDSAEQIEKLLQSFKNMPDQKIINEALDILRKEVERVNNGIIYHQQKWAEALAEIKKTKDPHYEALVLSITQLRESEEMAGLPEIAVDTLKAQRETNEGLRDKTTKGEFIREANYHFHKKKELEKALAEKKAAISTF